MVATIGAFSHYSMVLKLKSMFGLFKKDPIKKLEAEYAKLMEAAMHIQRSGDLKLYAAKIAEAEELMQKIEALRKQAQ
jgi:hypothetical protein